MLHEIFDGTTARQEGAPAVEIVDVNVSETDVFVSVRFRTSLGSVGLNGDVTATAGGESQQFGFSRNADPAGIDVTETFPFEFPNNEGETGEVEAFVEVGDGLAAETDTATFTVGETVDGGGDGGSGGGGDTDPTLTLADISSSCSTATGDFSPGDTTTVSVDVEGFAPPSTQYDVDVVLESNGREIGIQTVPISPNGGGFADFQVRLPEVGTYSFDHELQNLRRV